MMVNPVRGVPLAQERQHRQGGTHFYTVTGRGSALLAKGRTGAIVFQ